MEYHYYYLVASEDYSALVQSTNVTLSDKSQVPLVRVWITIFAFRIVNNKIKEEMLYYQVTIIAD